MAETVEELTVTYEDGGIETVKELDKKLTSFLTSVNAETNQIRKK